MRAARSDLDRFGERLAEADPELWPGDPEVIRNRLGWVPVVGEMRPRAGELEAFADDVRRALPHTVLLGMGGSSLCPEVLRRAFHADALHVLDTTHPRAVVRAARDDCLYLVASKSGGTIETRSHEAYFFDQSGGDPARFAAVSDPGTELARSAVARGYRRVFENRPDIGGRYSALSYFGLVPAALAGIDVGRLLGGVETSGADGVELGRRLGELHAEGRDKVTIVAEGEYAGFGLWAEQLLAESTGKEGTGLVPVAGEPLGPPDVYGDDRVFVYLRANGSQEPAVRALEESGQPVLVRALGAPDELGNEFFQWEVATAAAGRLLGINPFDEPNVQESKDNTQRVLAAWQERGELPEAAADTVDDVLDALEAGSYLAIMAYVDPSDENEARFRRGRVALRDRHRVATTFGFGPRFLHSTGQLHKGGPQVGCFVQIVDPEAGDLPIPGRPFGFGTLIRAQALGDLEALRRRGRPVARLTPDEFDRLANG